MTPTLVLLQCVALKLYDQLFKPIALYGSELWGPDVIKHVTDYPTKYLNCLSKFTAEKLNMSFARFVLGIRKKDQNCAIF